MSKYIIALFLCLFLLSCSPMQQTDSAQERQPTPTPTPIEIPAFSIAGTWVATMNDNQTIILDIRTVGNYYIGVVDTIAYGCVDFAPIGGVNYPEVQENHSPLTITNIDNSTDEMSIPLFGGDGSKNLGEYTTTLVFTTQYPSPDTIEATSNSSGEFITLTFRKSNDTASNIANTVQSQYKHAKC